MFSAYRKGAVMYLWSPSTRRHVVGQTIFDIWSKVDVLSRPTSMSRRSNRTVLLDTKHRLLILQQLRITPISLIASSLSYNIETTSLTIESNSKWGRCRLAYNSQSAILPVYRECRFFISISKKIPILTSNPRELSSASWLKMPICANFWVLLGILTSEVSQTDLGCAL